MEKTPTIADFPAETEAQALAAIDPEMRVGDALELLRRSPGTTVPVVLPDTGEVVGLLSRPQHVLMQRAAVPRLGGMATPLGVYLTDGVSSGGAGFWGLFLSGVLLCALGLIAQGAAQGLIQALTPETKFAGAGIAVFAPSLDIWLGQIGINIAPTALTLLLIFTLLRLTPLAGTHAAEHQVVHCLERGAPLVPDCVRTMPRVHPRCGTNLVVGFFLFHLVFLAAFSAALIEHFATFDAVTLGLVAAAPLALIFWRRAGGWVQHWLATRPATDAQIRSAIRAAEDVLARRRQRSTAVRFRFPRRLWSMGLVQVMLGYFALLSVLMGLAFVWPALGTLLGL